MKLPRLTDKTPVSDGAGRPANLFARFWDQICGAIESPAIPTRTPASHTDTGTVGQIIWDANFIYICVATNSWKRVAIASW